MSIRLHPTIIHILPLYKRHLFPTASEIQAHLTSSSILTHPHVYYVHATLKPAPGPYSGSRHNEPQSVGAAGPSAAVVASATSVKLHDVMDEELAVKLQREEQDQWEREMEGRFGGDDRQTGWCFVEVPSSSSGNGVMSVIQQEVTVEDAHEDPDYTFALELQAQEAEEYDRMRRQEASSMERVRVVRQEDPKREEVRHTLQRYYDREAHREFDQVGANDAVEVASMHHNGEMSTSQGATKAVGKPMRPRLHDHDVYLDGAGWRVPKKQSDRKARHRAKNASSGAQRI